MRDRNTLSQVSIIEQPVVDNDPSNELALDCVIDVPVLTANVKGNMGSRSAEIGKARSHQV